MGVPREPWQDGCPLEFLRKNLHKATLCRGAPERLTDVVREQHG